MYKAIQYVPISLQEFFFFTEVKVGHIWAYIINISINQDKYQVLRRDI